MTINRRVFLKSTGLALVAGGFLPSVFVRMAEASTTHGNRTLVTIFLRGAVDGLNVVVPYGERSYYASRPTIAIPRPGSSDGVVDLDGFFGVHPSLTSLVPFYKDHGLGFVHAAGSPDPTRSHFDAQDFMESGTPGVKSTRDGFLSRAIGRPARGDSPLRAVSLTSGRPRILSGGANAVSMESLDDFGLRAGRQTDPAEKSFESMYASSAGGEFSRAATDSFEAIQVLKKSHPSRISPANGAEYPRGPLGDALRQIAELIKANVGLEVAFTDATGWDTHVGEGGSQGQLASRLRDYAQSIAAFMTDLGSRMGDVTLVTMSEFGRTVKENGNRGTDHGHGNFMLVAGGGVEGGKVHGRWPGLDRAKLYQDRDLAVTTDFRQVMGEILVKRAGVRTADLDTVFPGFANDPKGWVGVA